MLKNSFFAIFVFAGLVYLNPALADCEASMLAQRDSEAWSRQRSQNDAVARNFNAELQPPSPEVAAGAEENLNSFAKTFWLQPATRQDPVVYGMYADAYVGNDYKTQLPEIYVLPNDNRIMCLLTPDSGLFLSDNVTNHFAEFDASESDNRVSILDRWASVSFMLEGHNAIGVKAHLRVDAQSTPFINLSIDDFYKVLHGILQKGDLQKFFQVLDKVYPELSQTSDYLFWKRSRMIASGDIVLAAFAKQHGIDPRDPRLQLLDSFVDDININLITNFSAQISSVQIPPNQRESAFIQRVADYGRMLPWSLRWMLVTRIRFLKNKTLRDRALKTLLLDHSDDIDIQIELASNLQREGYVDEANDAIVQAAELWSKSAGALFSKHSQADAVELALSRRWGLATTQILDWEHARIRLLQLTLERVRDKQLRGPLRLTEVQRTYWSGSILQDFPRELLRLFLASNDSEDLRQYLNLLVDGINRNQNSPVATALINALYDFFVEDYYAGNLDADLRQKIFTGVLGNYLCREAAYSSWRSGDVNTNLQNQVKGICNLDQTRSAR